MVRLEEGKTNQRLIELGLIVFVKKYKKPEADDLEVGKLVHQISCVLDLWDYTYQEIQHLDRKAFMDLMKSYYDKLRDSKDKELFTRVFAL